ARRPRSRSPPARSPRVCPPPRPFARRDAPPRSRPSPRSAPAAPHPRAPLRSGGRSPPRQRPRGARAAGASRRPPVAARAPDTVQVEVDDARGDGLRTVVRAVLEDAGACHAEEEGGGQMARRAVAPEPVPGERPLDRAHHAPPPLPGPTRMLLLVPLHEREEVRAPPEEAQDGRDG